MPNYYNNQFNPYGNPPGTWTPNQPYPVAYSGSGSHLQNPQPVNNLLRVAGPESAKAYPMGPNSSMVLFDGDNPTFYMVTTDANGFKSIRTFDFVERAEEDQQEPKHAAQEVDTSAFATKEDLADIQAELAKVSKALKGLM